MNCSSGAPGSVMSVAARASWLFWNEVRADVRFSARARMWPMDPCRLPDAPLDMPCINRSRSSVALSLPRALLKTSLDTIALHQLVWLNNAMSWDFFPFWYNTEADPRVMGSSQPEQCLRLKMRQLCLQSCLHA